MVVLLIGMMLLIAVPRVRDTLLNDSLRAAVRHLIGTARDLRTEAVREQVDYVLQIDLNGQAFWSYTADATAEKQAALRKTGLRFPEGVRVTGVRHAGEAGKADGDASIRFFRRGYAEPTVVFLAKDERTFTLVFNPFLQAVTIYEKRVDFFFNEADRAASY